MQSGASTDAAAGGAVLTATSFAVATLRARSSLRAFISSARALAEFIAATRAILGSAPARTARATSTDSASPSSPVSPEALSASASAPSSSPLSLGVSAATASASLVTMAGKSTKLRRLASGFMGGWPPRPVVTSATGGISTRTPGARRRRCAPMPPRWRLSSFSGTLTIKSPRASLLASTTTVLAGAAFCWPYPFSCSRCSTSPVPRRAFSSLANSGMPCPRTTASA